MLSDETLIRPVGQLLPSVEGKTSVKNLTFPTNYFIVTNIYITISFMNQTPINRIFRDLSITSILHSSILRSFVAGLLVPCGFAPIHLPGLAILGIAFLFIQLRQKTVKQSFFIGFAFGIGFFGLGISWVYNSIHNYGHLNPPLSAFITLVFIAYLALFPALVAMLYQRLTLKKSLVFNCFLFSALWCLGEFLRSTFLSGFPWLLLGVGQFDTPLKYLLPIIGIYGVGFITCLASTCLAASIQTTRRTRRYLWIIACIGILISPLLLKNQEWTSTESSAVSVGVIQANLSMRDKWDEALFWKLLERYEHDTVKLIGKKQLIVMPESAIPVPMNYVSDFLNDLDLRATKAGSTILLGIPQPTSNDDTAYYNTLATLGLGKGSYLKQHLVPFGEFIPHPFLQLTQWLSLPAANMKSGKSQQPLVLVNNHPIATLICYEVAYPQLLRNQLPQAEWIVSISDDGWFGHSMAVYQQLQMSQVLSMLTGRFQVVANNDGLSSIINTQGDVIDSLPAFSSGILNASVTPAYGATPWIYFGDAPVLLLSLLTVLMALLGLSRRFVRVSPNTIKGEPEVLSL